MTMDKRSCIVNWWLDLVNQIDEALLKFVARRRGVSFIYYFTDPAAWDEFMREVLDESEDGGVR